MEETLPQDPEYKTPNEDQGGLRHRLRDRELLRKRKAEAEEKETNQMESKRKRSRPADKSSSKRRGRPRKSEATAQNAALEEASGPAEVNPDQKPNTPLTSFTTAAEESTPVFGSAQSLIFGPFQSPASAPALTSPLSQALESPPAPGPGPGAVPVPPLSQGSVRTEAPAPPSAFVAESPGNEAPNQILIEDLGPDEEEDVAPSQDDTADEDLRETLSINEPEQTKMYSVPLFSSAPLPQQYFPGNQL